MVADGCGGQNKNAMLVTIAMKWLFEVRFRYPALKNLEIVFPVTGHSFIPPDRVFALESIIEPQEYVNIRATHATIHKLGTWSEPFENQFTFSN